MDLQYIATAPGGTHYLGTDPYGRDVLAELLAGAFGILTISLPAALLATTIGVALGIGAGFWGNHGVRHQLTDWLSLAIPFCAWLVTGSVVPTAVAAAVGGGSCWVARQIGTQLRVSLPLADAVVALMLLLNSVPRMILLLAISSVWVQGPLSLIILLALTGWPGTARIARAEALRTVSLPFVESARAVGLSNWRILIKHILLPAWPVLRSLFPLNLSLCLTLQTTLSFLGLGVSVDTADWGRLLASSRLEPGAWWLIAFPGGVLAATILALRFGFASPPNR
ncbi:ABC transporter permease [Hymenobacter koreensis]|uniref:ABC transporter permease n=1 Tax=Hymenobacter koreensis TaxID=1084523 RepID=UPI0031EF7FF2